MTGNKLVIFDCDGTLVDSQHMIISAMHETFKEAGLTPVTDTAVRSIVGLSLYEAIEALLPGAGEELHRDLESRYKGLFYKMRVEHQAGPDPLYDGTLEALNALNDAGYLLGVATGNSQRGLARVIKEHDLDGMFVTLQTADGHPSKPHPSMITTAASEAGASIDDTVMIGDTSYDIMMAVRAGSHPLGVDWGYHSAEDLRAAGAKHVASRYNEIPQLVEQWIGKP
jgi:phosphoglycolate phosphatase